jgi:GNAT superfamily N-acetyltransferase
MNQPCDSKFMQHASTSSNGQPPVTFRPGTAGDSYAVFVVFEQTLADLLQRTGNQEPAGVHDQESLAQMWEDRRSLYEHLAQSADEFWVAEQRDAVVGFARSVVRDGLQALTELFVRPEAQSAGVGSGLLARALPQGRAGSRLIIASPDVRAQAQYIRAGLTPRFPVYYCYRAPRAVALPTGIRWAPVTEAEADLTQLAAIDRAVIGHSRSVDHRWLLGDRDGWFYHKQGRLIGYGYTGRRNGPFALLETGAFAEVLTHAEARAAAAGRTHFGVETPGANHEALAHLLANGFHIDPFLAILLADHPCDRWARYLLTSPPFIW